MSSNAADPREATQNSPTRRMVASTLTSRELAESLIEDELFSGEDWGEIRDLAAKFLSGGVSEQEFGMVYLKKCSWGSFQPMPEWLLKVWRLLILVERPRRSLRDERL